MNLNIKYVKLIFSEQGSLDELFKEAEFHPNIKSNHWQLTQEGIKWWDNL
jgi:hypothetical protein